MSATLNRRALAASLFATAAVPASALAACILPAAVASLIDLAPADPVFAALVSREAASRQLAAVLAETAGNESPEADALFKAGDQRLAAADNTLRATTPTTLAGLSALTHHYAATASDPDSDGITHLVEVLAAMTGAARPLPQVRAVDPIFAAIATVRVTSAALTAALAGLDEDDDAQMRRADVAADRDTDARNALSRVRPTTDAGFSELVRFHAADAAEMEPDTFGALALRDIADAMNALARASPD